jgi:SAM-dependent methyltransferase
MSDEADQIIGIYKRHFEAFDHRRGRSLFEKIWLDRFREAMGRHATVLDVGCGMGEPIARYMIDHGHTLTGVDTSPGMIGLCRERFPDHEWIQADMRGLDLGRAFGGVIAFNSFFHLTRADQNAMFPVFGKHAAPGAPLLFTSGPGDGEAIGEMEGEPLYHASLDPDEYRSLMDDNGFDVLKFIPDDPECNGHCVWLAKRRYDPGR